MIRASQDLIPRVFWMTCQGSRDDMLPFYEDETAAIHRRDQEAARGACVGRSYLMAQAMLAELFRRRVFTAPDDVSRVAPAALRVVAPAQTIRAEPSLAL
jgi:hypothetical protein